MSARGFLAFFFIFSLWDIYLEVIGVRPLDMFGLGALGLFLARKAITGIHRPKDHDAVLAYSLLGFWCIVYSTLGLINSLNNFKPIVGFTLGFLIFCSFHLIKISKQTIVYCTSVVIIVHASYFTLQLVYFYLFGDVLNIYSGIGLEPRALSVIFRPTGLYLEPASYSVSMLMLLALRASLIGRFDRLFYIVILTIFLSVSLWGVAVSVIFLLFALRSTALLAMPFIAGFALVGFLFQDNEIVSQILDDFLLERIRNLGVDNSTQDRYGALLDQSELGGSYWVAIFGKGISNEYHIFGSNGLAFLLSSGGLMGLLIFVGLLILLNRGPNLIAKLTILAIFLTAAPLWNTFFWWFWLALFLKAKPNLDSSNPKSNSLERRIYT